MNAKKAGLRYEPGLLVMIAMEGSEVVLLDVLEVSVGVHLELSGGKLVADDDAVPVRLKG